MAEEKYVPRFKTKYNDEVRAKLIEQFGYTNPMFTTIFSIFGIIMTFL